MKFPYFVSDILFFATLLAIVSISFFYENSITFPIASISFVLLLYFMIANHEAYVNFDEKTKKINGLQYWRPKFWSLGELDINYKNQKMTYGSYLSCLGEKLIPADYYLKLQSKIGDFEAVNSGTDENKFIMKGEKRALADIEPEIEAFNNKHSLKSIINRNGVLEVRIRLAILKDGYSAKGEDITDLFTDLLDFSYKINKKLKAMEKNI